MTNLIAVIVIMIEMLIANKLDTEYSLIKMLREKKY
jgi:hypothetical protein